ncbi:MAG: sortase [Anaerolineae bacterium]|nr:sortase [Anaerolineae bacterium]
MKDRRPVDELSIEELEEILRLRKRQARFERVRQQRGEPGARDPLSPAPPLPAAPDFASPVRPVANGDRPRYGALVQENHSRGRRKIQWRWVWDRVLLLVEILALIGLVFVVIQMTMTIEDLNEESQLQQAFPTPTATPVIAAVVLPGGHTPPDAQGQSAPAEIPAHLRNLVARLTPLPVPTPGPEHALRIVIASIAVDAPVVEGDDWESLKKGAGHHLGSANPGERGNCVISAHNDIYGEIFRDLPEVKVGDVVLVHTATQVYRYIVRQTRIIEPTEVSVMAPTSSPVLTLISCYPYGIDTHRIVVIAELES